MTDTTLGYLLVALGVIFVLGLVFTATARDPRGRGPGSADAPPSRPPAGVHLPPPSWLPVLFALAAGILAAGLVFTPWVLLAGVVVLLLGALGWYRAAGREWRGVAEGEGHDGSGHE